MRLTFKLVCLVKQIAYCNVDAPHPVSGSPEQNKKAKSLLSKRILLSDGPQTGTLALSCLQTCTEM